MVKDPQVPPKMQVRVDRMVAAVENQYGPQDDSVFDNIRQLGVTLYVNGLWQQNRNKLLTHNRGVYARYKRLEAKTNAIMTLGHVLFTLADQMEQLFSEVQRRGQSR